jgi:hypothetical protein
MCIPSLTHIDGVAVRVRSTPLERLVELNFDTGIKATMPATEILVNLAE